jgi:glycosyltransferase involved in cell wall biosynthesis
VRDPGTVVVVVAAFNEARSVGAVVAALRAREHAVIVVDDGSADETAAIARAAGASVLRHPINRGQGAALQTGILHALRRGARCIVTFDADGQHDVADLPHLIEPILAGRADVVLGSRFLGGAAGIPALRRLQLRAAVVLTRLVSRVRVTDAHNGLRAFSRRAAERIEITIDRMGHASEIIDRIRWLGLSFVEVPVRVRYTEYSLAKGQRGRDALPILVDYLVRRLRR